ncbi:hypothetical protein Dimus_018819 [Dionaea muscipula]
MRFVQSQQKCFIRYFPRMDRLRESFDIRNFLFWYNFFFFCYEDAYHAIEALDGKLIYDGYCRMDIDFINILLWVVHNNKGIEASSTIVPSTIISSTIVPSTITSSTIVPSAIISSTIVPSAITLSALEPSACEPLIQSTLVPPQLTVRPSDSTAVDSSSVDSSLSFRTSKLDSSPQTRLNSETFSNTGFPSTIPRLVKVSNDHEFKINVDLSIGISDLAQKTFAEMFKRDNF